MKQVSMLVLLLCATSLFAQPGDHYHDFYEIQDYIFQVQEEFPAWVSIDSIGHSKEENLPIHLIKISDHVAQDMDRPTVLIMGQLHAEEILGIEIVLRLLDFLTLETNYDAIQFRRNLEIYLVPTMNPEGLRVVWGQDDDCPPDSIDDSFRKNKHDTMGDGIFHYAVGPGGDFSGVDLNRNFDINWFAGDTLLQRRGRELYDYYRGPYPVSEPEVQCMVEAIYEIQPLLSVMFHSSRTGDYSRQVMFPHNWGNDNFERVPPDYDILYDIANDFANEMTYTPIASVGRNGKLHDWMYTAGGWINMQTEVGTAEIQPNEAGMEAVITRVFPGVMHLLNRARANPELEADVCHLKVVATNENGSPMVAEVFLPDRHDGYMSPRYTDPVFGVHRRMLLHGTYQVVTRQWGYVPDTTQVFLSTDFVTTHNVQLEPLPHHHVSIGIYDGEDGPAMPGKLVIHRAYGIDTVFTESGFHVRDWPVGDYEVEAWADGYVPRRFVFTLNDDIALHATLSQPVSTIQYDFEQEEIPEAWAWDGDFPWGRSGMDKHDGIAALESDPGQTIDEGTSGWASVTFSLPENPDYATITGWRCYEFEPDDDFCYIEIRYDNGEWIPLETLNGFSRWQQFFYNLNDRGNATTIELRWCITTDDTDVDRGLFLDDVALHTSEYLSVEDDVELPGSWQLGHPYPNPFNPETTVEFVVPVQADVTIAVYDILGREVLRALDNVMDVGIHRVSINMNDFASGMYFVRMNAPGYTAVRKMMLLR